MKKIKILLADDHQIVRSGLRTMLEKHNDMEVIGEAEDGRMAVKQVRKLSPDVVVVDVTMPDLNGIEATRQIIHDDPGARIVMCSALGQEALVIESIAAGARDFIVKPFTAEKVLRVLRAAASPPEA